MPVTVTKAKKYKYDGNFAQDTTTAEVDLKAVEKPTFSAGGCDNFALDLTLNIIYEAVPDKDVATFKITKAELEVTYGSLTNVPATEKKQISRTTSVNYISSADARKNRGSPGYRIGQKLKVGTKTQAPLQAGTLEANQKPYILEYKDGFSLRGADNTGQCYYIGKSIKKPETTATGTPLIQNVNELNYFEDPVLTLDDSTIYGCHLDFTFDEL